MPMMKGRRRRVAPPRICFGNPAYCFEPLRRCWHSSLNHFRLMLIQRDDAELEIPIVLPSDQLHVTLVLGEPRCLCRKTQRVVYVFEKS